MKLYVDAVAAEEDRAEEARQHAREQCDKEAAHKAARPARWRALPLDAKLYYLAAAKQPRTATDALIAMAHLSEGVSEWVLSQPPATFEPDLAR